MPMDKETQGKWDASAKGIARGVFKSMMPEPKELADTLGGVMSAKLKVRDDRIAELERRLADLERQMSGETTEWPIPERTAA